MPDLGPNRELIGRPGSRTQLRALALVVDLAPLERNIARIADYATTRGVALRPHAKTHKSVGIARMQVASGALGICIATLGEAEVTARTGIAGVLPTSPVVTPAKIDRLAALDRDTEGLMVVADHPDNVAALAGAATENRRLKVVAALDLGGNRIGAADPDAALALAKRIADADTLEFAGIHAYAGPLQDIADYRERRRLAAAARTQVADLRDRLLTVGLSPPMISCVGTGTLDIDARYGPHTELQIGIYIFTDVEYSAVVLREDAPRPFEPALFVRRTVISANLNGTVTTDAGLKRFATDSMLQEIAIGASAGATHTFKGDEHGRVSFVEAEQTWPLGVAIGCLTPHCDPTVNLYDPYLVVRGDTLVDIWPKDARVAI